MTVRSELETAHCPACGEPLGFDGNAVAEKIAAGELSEGQTFELRCPCGWHESVAVVTPDARPS